jgi:hypothetical protein
MTYPANIIIQALQRNPALDFQGIDMVQCPRPDVIDDNTRCVNKPDTCLIGHEQKCKQHIHIFRNNKLLRIIEIRFMFSPTNASGFINSEDKSLNSLLQNKIISL